MEEKKGKEGKEGKEDAGESLLYYHEMQFICSTSANPSQSRPANYDTRI
jgi:hypothetical protein